MNTQNKDKTSYKEGWGGHNKAAFFENITMVRDNPLREVMEEAK